MDVDQPSDFIALEPIARSSKEGCGFGDGAVVFSRPMDCSDSSVVVPELSGLTVPTCSAQEVDVDLHRTHATATRQNVKGERCRIKYPHVMLA